MLNRPASKKSFNRAFLCATAMAGCLAAWDAPQAAILSQDRTLTYNIQEQSLSGALLEYGRVSGSQIIFTEDLVAGLRAPALRGAYSSSEALNRLLSGSGLRVARTPAGTLMIVSSRPQNAAARLQGISTTARFVQDTPPARAPEPPQAPLSGPVDIGEVIVTATRIVRDGYNAPTPTTVFGEEDLDRSGQINAFTAVNQLPSLAGSNSTSTFGTTQSTGTGGLSSLNLRGLGATRTLTLLDGQRVVGALNTGVTDAGAFPQALVKRVDIVTGGASASWGSDAVAGVVNYILDHDFTGFKGRVSGGVTTYGDNAQHALTLTAGTRLLDGRLRLVASGEYQDNDGIQQGIGDRGWYDGTRVLQRTIAGTPAGEPQYIVAPRVVDIRLAPGGIITSGPLSGITFGPGGEPRQFQYGSLIISPNMAGGEQSGDIGNNSNLDSAQRRRTFYGRIGYELTPDFSIHATYNYGDVRTFGHSWPGQYRTGTLNIRCDNAYLPQSIVDACAANNITSFQFGSYLADLPDSIAFNTRSMNRFSAGLDGSYEMFGNRWTLSAYAARGESYTNSQVLNGGLNGLLFAAIDAVRGPNGAIVCRNPVAQANGCVPFNAIGTGVASQAAIDYVTGTPYIKTWLTQDVAAVSSSGTLFDNWAGPVSLALGVEYRREAFRQEADAASTGDAGNPVLSPGGRNWFTGNFQPASGSYDVWEGFVETVVPLFENDAMGQADLSLAARATEYSQSGYVTTWKVGGSWDTPLAGLRLRGLVSQDIRAPNLSELFRAPQNIAATVIDRFPPFAGVDTAINDATVSNSSLSPERSRTQQVGAIYQPAWLDGFSASLDYYRIRVRDAIGSISLQQTMDLCFQGDQRLCDFIIRNSAGAVTSIERQPINLASTDTHGLDIEASFRRPVSDFIPDASGTITLRALATHVFKYDTDSGLPGAIVNHQAGENRGSIANWRVYATQSYAHDDFSLTLIQRYVSPGVINNNYVECNGNCPAPTLQNPTINNNRIDGAFYVDLGGAYKISDRVEFFFKVDNLFNVDPPIAPYVGSAPFVYRATNASLYDLMGRFYRAGIRFTL